MPVIEKEFPVKGSGVKKQPVLPRHTHVCVSIASCATPGTTFNIKRTVAASTEEYEIDGGLTLGIGESATLNLPNTSAIIITPSDGAVEYDAVVSCY